MERNKDEGNRERKSNRKIRNRHKAEQRNETNYCRKKDESKKPREYEIASILTKETGHCKEKANRTKEKKVEKLWATDRI